jgi:DNA repair protein RadA/Sms
MAKSKQVFACSSCGSVHTKWHGKCPDCNAWDSLVAETLDVKVKVDPRATALAGWAHHAHHANHNTNDPSTPDPNQPNTSPAADTLATAHASAQAGRARPVREVDANAHRAATRIATGINELDRVLGGGLVAGSAVLLGGDPGIGKSTLMLQAAGALARRATRVLYVSSEESAQQVSMRAARLGAADLDELFILSDTSLTRISEQAARVLSQHPTAPTAPVLIIDSVQMVYHPHVDAFPGSLTQLRRCTAELVFMAKASGAAVVLVGHVTKDGVLAGPRLLEHLVDAVLYFEGDRYHARRVVRAVKNRFGSTLEIGLFEMTGSGLTPAPDGALIAASAAAGPPRPGTVVCPVQTGTRTLLVELQALTATGFPGAVKRKSSGLDSSRLAMLIAVLEQHAGLRLADRDVFASAVGGVRVAEPAADLALLLAIASAHYKKAIPPRTAVAGEVGLGGEVRPVAQLQARLHEAARLGFTHIIVPASPSKQATKPPAQSATPAGPELIEVRDVNQAIALLG